MYSIYIFNPKQVTNKKSVQPLRSHGEKRCEIQGACQKMAVMYRLMAKT